MSDSQVEVRPPRETVEPDLPFTVDTKLLLNVSHRLHAELLADRLSELYEQQGKIMHALSAMERRVIVTEQHRMLFAKAILQIDSSFPAMCVACHKPKNGGSCGSRECVVRYAQEAIDLGSS